MPASDPSAWEELDSLPRKEQAPPTTHAQPPSADGAEDDEDDEDPEDGDDDAEEFAAPVEAGARFVATSIGAMASIANGLAEEAELSIRVPDNYTDGAGALEPLVHRWPKVVLWGFGACVAGIAGLAIVSTIVIVRRHAASKSPPEDDPRIIDVPPAVKDATTGGSWRDMV